MSAAPPDPAVIVSVAVAFPLESKATEFELSEQLGEPACAGCTLQASDTGLSNAFSKAKVSVEVVLWPGLTLLGLSADAEIEKSVPAVFSSRLIVLSLLTVTKSGDLSPSRSDDAAPKTRALVGVKFTGAWKVPSPLPAKTPTERWPLTTQTPWVEEPPPVIARSSLPSPSKSAAMGYLLLHPSPGSAATPEKVPSPLPSSKATLDVVALPRFE